MKNFAMVQAQFRQLNCGQCEAAFAPEGIKLLRAEASHYVVRVHCTNCDHNAGVAVVGLDDSESDAASENRSQASEARASVPKAFGHAREVKKFAALAPIGTDDVLDAHAFFADLGADWMRHLPRSR